MSFFICQIPIIKPWFRSSFLTSPIWRFAVGDYFVKGWQLSDGGKPPKGQMVAYPTSAIFVRDLKLNFGNQSGFANWVNDQSSSSASGGGGLSFGPFSCGGSYSNWKTQGQATSNQAYHYDENGMSIPDMQLIGFKCHINPLTPNPDSGIKTWV
jgi:hypothetical protein